jgi:hypothetical protein
MASATFQWYGRHHVAPWGVGELGFQLRDPAVGEPVAGAGGLQLLFQGQVGQWVLWCDERKVLPDRSVQMGLIRLGSGVGS